jgi:hypothetical protein
MPNQALGLARIGLDDLMAWADRAAHVKQTAELLVPQRQAEGCCFCSGFDSSHVGGAQTVAMAVNAPEGAKNFTTSLQHDRLSELRNRTLRC